MTLPRLFETPWREPRHVQHLSGGADTILSDLFNTSRREVCQGIRTQRVAGLR